MPENPKEKKDGTWEEDQKKREYYYDDSHGYEDFDPEKDEPDNCDTVSEGRGDTNQLTTDRSS